MKKILIALVILIMVQSASANVKLWDTKIKEPEKDYGVYSLGDTLSWANKANWIQVPYGTTNYNFIGNTIVETDTYYYLFHTGNRDSPMMYPKYSSGVFLPDGLNHLGAEMYGYGVTPTDPDLENMHLNSVSIKKNDAQEVSLRVDNGGYGSNVILNTNIMIYTFKGTFVSATPENSYTYGLKFHAGYTGEGVAIANDESGNDVIINPYYDAITKADGTKYTGWTDTYAPATNKRFIMQLAIIKPGDPTYNLMFMMIPNVPSASSPFFRTGAPRGYFTFEEVGSGDIKLSSVYNTVSYTVISNPNQWWEATPGSDVSIGTRYTASYKPTIPGAYRMTGKYLTSTGWVYKTVNVTDNNFVLDSPVNGKLVLVLIYLYDRTISTPANVITPMDVYRGKGYTSTPIPTPVSTQIPTPVPTQKVITSSSTGSMSISSNPPQASIIVNNQVVGVTNRTGNNVINMPAVPFYVTIVKEGYKSITDFGVVIPGKTVQKNYNLQPVNQKNWFKAWVDDFLGW